MIHRPGLTMSQDWMCSAMTAFLSGQAWLVLMVPFEYTTQVFSADSKIFCLAYVIFNQHLD
jgi:hypothetical protein